eukprot:XP_015571057.1 uncharacterized protein LOC8288044 isoform X2 [Ricinus communis]
MTLLNLSSPLLSCPPHIPKLAFNNKSNFTLLSLLLSTSSSFKPSPFPPSRSFSSKSKASLSEDNGSSIPVPDLLLSANEDSLARLSSSRDADEALQLISEISGRRSGLVSISDSCAIITAALDRNNADLALSIFYSMRSSFDQGVSENGWKWSRPDVSVYTLLVQGLASALKVSDALKTIDYICRVGVSPGEEVPFGKVVRCPSCKIAVAVAQPQHGIQIASCSKCRYKYELVSGDITTINSEEISKDLPAWERGLRFLQLMKRSIPTAVHSIVVQTPSGSARTHRFATETVDLPAQEGERVTIASAAPSNVYRNVGPFKFSPKAPNTYPGEPMCLTNHENGQESPLLRAPVKDGNLSLLNPSVLIPLLAVLATGDAASGIIDPSLPQFLSVAAIASLGVGATLNSLVLPQLNQLPQKSVDTVAIKQQLLSQYDVLQSRIRDLKVAAEKEISSMIEIEVEMDSDVLAAEAVGNAETIAEQIQQIMELENLEERWKLQAEANDEAERLLSSQPMPTERV